ncbi:hypothetical protein RB195_015882 [Necator americanus]|uniref:Piwi domain-containing protein n=1 Tax=Necator americanus TaxID=51031 RepID=A0ABR1E719_NECAM
MASSSAQQLSAGPAHSKAGGEVCPIYSRPGQGTSGDRIQLVVNWYRLNCRLEGRKVHLYEVGIQKLERPRRRGKPPKRGVVKSRDRVRLVFWQCMRDYEDVFGPYIETIFDDFEKAFSLNYWQLNAERCTFNVKCQDDDRSSDLSDFEVSIKYLSDFIFKVDSDDIRQSSYSTLLTKCLFTQRARYAPPSRDPVMAFINRWDVCYGSIYYIPRQEGDPKVIVGPGVRAWLGVYASVKTLQNSSPALAFGLVNRLFYELKMDIITFYCEVLEELNLLGKKRETWRNTLKGMGMNEIQRTRMTDRLKGVRLKTDRFLIRDRDGSYRFGERHLIFEEVAGFTARNYRMPGGGTTMDHIYYCLSSTLEFPQLPLCKVRAGPKIFLLPMEVLFIHEKPQRYTKMMGNFMRTKFIKGVCRSPSVHKRLTDQLFDMMEFDSRNVNFVHNFMFDIAPEMIGCNGLVLNAPTVIDKERNSVPMTEQRAIKRKELNEPPDGELHCVIIIMAREAGIGSDVECRNVCDRDSVILFFNDLMEKCRERGLNVASQPLIQIFESTTADKFEERVESARNCFLALQNGSQRKILLLLIINDRTDTHDHLEGNYGLIKAVCDNKYGIASQVVDASTVSNAIAAKKKTVYYNIALKINAKLGGVNQAVVLDVQSGTAEVSSKDAVMFVGIDVTHPTSDSGIDISIACMVASFDLAATRYANEIVAQMKPGETVERFQGQFIRLMTKFRERTGVWPRHIVLFRDGVSDSEMLRTTFLELKCIRDSWKRITVGDADLEPTYTYIVLQKRHLTRFYQPAKDEQGKETYVNVPSGTVVDNTVVSPKFFDFYLASQFGAIGTTRPAHYTVVVDEWGLSADQIYEMCYRLCFLYARCRIPVSLPCPVYYAHIVCEKAKEVYKALCRNHEFDTVEDALKKIRIEERLSVHQEYPGMHFV